MNLPLRYVVPRRLTFLVGQTKTAIDRRTPLIFLDTGKLFGQTLGHRDAAVERLGLADIRSLALDPVEVVRRDGDGTLSRRDANACRRLRKVEPLERGLAGFEAASSDRRRRHGGLPLHPVEAEGFRSTGCMPCTDPVAPRGTPRAGRWHARGKSECGVYGTRGLGNAL